MAFRGGGVFGGWLGVLFVRGFGKACTLVLVFGLLFVLALFLFGITPRGLWVTILYRIRIAGEKRAEKKKMQKPRTGGLAERNRIREEEYAAYLREKKQREKEARLAAREAERKAAAAQTMTEPGCSGTQMSVPQPQPTVYRVKKRKITDIPLEDGDYEEVPAKETDIDIPETTEPETGVVDDRIFDEVMRRTRERVEKSAKKSGVDLKTADGTVSAAPVETLQTAEGALQVNTSTGEVLQAEISGSVPAEVPEEDDVPWYEDMSSMEDCMEFERPAVPEKPVQTGGNTASEPAEPAETPEETAESFDLSGFFVNPEDAELLDRLSEAYLKKEDKPSSMEVNREIMASGAEEQKTESRKAVPVPYNYPPFEILTEDTDDEPVDIKEELQDNAVKLVETLKSFHVNTKIENISRGPTITRYELKPEMGTKVRSISNLVDDIALNLATTGVRIEAPIPGKAAVGIEVPNKKQSTVHLRTLIQSEAFTGARSKLTCCLGEDVAGEAVYFDIAKMPHLLIAGATGMGKSVCINSLIVSLLYKASPEEVKLILVDPKKVELSIYNGIPHLLVPVVSEPKKAAGSLSWAVGEMERRFGLIEAVGVRDVKNFNEVTKDDPDYEFLPQIVIIIDELADLMMTAPDDVEESICRLAQKARAAGMHLIIGTQRPSVDVITGLIKANIPSRIAFTVASQIDSRTIIDRGGAENLIGRGDMLFNPVGALKPRRVQGAYVSESDVEEVVAYIKNMNSAYDNFDQEKIVNEIEREAQKCGA
ncbi:MAG: DNA translocase FtsK, partial [Clostridia bacterium]|nr:DNA translocase FtsK [Clostridia bacterium]